jgi:hypothetical protein
MVASQTVVSLGTQEIPNTGSVIASAVLPGRSLCCQGSRSTEFEHRSKVEYSGVTAILANSCEASRSVRW